MRKKRILFVCWGNTCRGPMAQAIASKILKGRVKVESAGIEASSGLVATKDAIAVMAERDINISAHKAKSINEIEINNFDIIVSMTPTIADEIRHKIDLEKTNLLSWNIIDPFGKGLEKYRKCAYALEKEIHNFIQDGECYG